MLVCGLILFLFASLAYSMSSSGTRSEASSKMSMSPAKRSRLRQSWNRTPAEAPQTCAIRLHILSLALYTCSVLDSATCQKKIVFLQKNCENYRCARYLMLLGLCCNVKVTENSFPLASGQHCTSSRERVMHNTVSFWVNTSVGRLQRGGLSESVI